MFDDIPDLYKHQTADNPEERLALHPGRQRRAASAGAADPRSRGALHRARGQGGQRGSPHGGVFLDIAWIKEKDARTPRSTSSASSRACTTSSRSWRPSTSPRSRWRSAPRPTTSMGGVRVDGDTQMSDSVPGFSPPARCGRPARRQPAGRQLALGSAGLREARRRVRGPAFAKENSAGQALTSPLVEGGDRGKPAGPARRAGRRSIAAATRRTRTPDPAGAPGDDAVG